MTGLRSQGLITEDGSPLFIDLPCPLLRDLFHLERHRGTRRSRAIRDTDVASVNARDRERAILSTIVEARGKDSRGGGREGEPRMDTPGLVIKDTTHYRRSVIDGFMTQVPPRYTRPAR